MPGFYISNFASVNKLDDCEKYEFKFNEIKDHDFIIKRKVINKFLDDKIIYSDNECIILTDGVVLNKINLINKHGMCSFPKLIKYLYRVNDIKFPNVLRGSFSGAYYDRITGNWTIYTNHIGNKPVFYYENKGRWIVSSSIIYIVQALKENGINYSINNNSVYNLISYGFMINNETLIKEIFRVEEGSTINLKFNGEFRIDRYYDIDNSEINHSNESEIIEKMNDKFINAVRLEYEKDIEYGYSHYANLSGGLDSRMSIWVANNIIGINNILCSCFSQTGYLDQIISQQIAADLGLQYIFKSLDDTNFLFDLEKSIYLNYGLCCSTGQLHKYSSEKFLDLSLIGLIHTGQLGDVIAGGSYLKNIKNNKKINKYDGFNSSFLLEKTENDYSSYKNQEMFKLKTRGFKGILCTDIILDTSSPFLDVDFMEYCLTIPLKYREGGIYKKWIIEKYPEAANYKWEKTNAKLTANKFIIAYTKIYKYGFAELINKLCKIIHFNYRLTSRTKYDMNPYNYWYGNVKRVKEFMDNYFLSNIDSNFINEELKQDLINMYNNVQAREKYQILTTLSAIKFYFGNVY